MATSRFKAFKFWLDENEYKEFRALLLTKEGKTVSEWLREQIRKYIRKNK